MGKTNQEEAPRAAFPPGYDGSISRPALWGVVVNGLYAVL